MGINAQWDYVIIGGGSAGCVLANRLSKEPSNRVLLLDAGRSDAAPSLHIPAGMLTAISNDKYNWKYPAKPDASRGGQEDLWSAGKAIGGGSAINGMFYIRGHRSDYDRWAQMGCHGWDYSSVLPYFKSLEICESGEDEYRGGNGPQSVSLASYRLPLIDRFVQVAQDCGHAFNPDYNGARQSGVAYAQGSQKSGRRFSTASAFLKPAKSRKNLVIELGAHVTHIGFDGNAARHVHYRKNGRDHIAAAGKEIILSAGAFGSPKILMQSGIGPGSQLKAFGIDLRVDAPQVGQNLMEHPAIYLTAKTQLKSLNAAAHPLRLPFVLADWLLRGRGAASVAAASAQVLCRSHEALAAPDIQLLLTPALFSYDPIQKKAKVLRENGFSIAALLLHPQSRGAVTLQSADPLAPPLIAHELLGAKHDLDLMVTAARKGAEIMDALETAGVITSREPEIKADSLHDDIVNYIRLASFRGDHGCGTCAMGAGPDSVTDPHLKVRGVQGLRVVDASIMPLIPSGNTNAPVLMIAEKAADMILKASA